jgi:ubiquitin-protein ligase E3 B
LASVLGKQLCPFDELASLDPLLYKNLTFVKHYSDSDDVEDLALTFSFQDEFLGKVRSINYFLFKYNFFIQIYTHELVPGGRDLKVNNENK